MGALEGPVTAHNFDPSEDAGLEAKPILRPVKADIEDSLSDNVIDLLPLLDLDPELIAELQIAEPSERELTLARAVLKKRAENSDLRLELAADQALIRGLEERIATQDSLIGELMTRLSSAVNDRRLLREIVNEFIAGQEELLEAASLDKLTGLKSSMALMQSIVGAVYEIERGHPDAGAAVLYMDLDGFKEVNDRLGHDKGDDVLKEFAALLQRLTRPYDTVSRFGGDEFGCLIKHVLPEVALFVAEKIREATFEEFKKYGVTVCVGVRMLKAGDIPVRVLKDADKAMYDAKHNGKNGVSQYNPQAPVPTLFDNIE